MTASAFDRLRALLDGVPPAAGLDPIALHLGESRLRTSPLDAAPLADPAGWTAYPPPGGTAALRAAYTDWLDRRYGAGAAVRDGRVAVEPTPGSKQALAVTIEQAVRASGGPGAAVVLPNPFYPTYHAAAEGAGARVVPYHLAGDDAAPIAAAVAAIGGRAAAVVVCDPGNPGGAVLPAGTLRAAGRIARDAGAVLVVDECYTDLYLDVVPAGYLTVAEPGSYVVLHTLSKRSAAPGLRAGFVAGDPATVARYAAYNRTCGVSTPVPVCAVAAALWSDDAHVADARAALSAGWDVADELLGRVPGYRRAAAGLFLWLPVGDDERMALDLWRDHALLTMPGRYLAVADATGANPGAGRLRIALGLDPATTRVALMRLAGALAGVPA